MEQQSVYTIYVDMDGVLVDLAKGVEEVSGISLEQLKTRGRELEKLLNEQPKNFWASLDWMPGGKDLWSYIQKYNPIILSTPANNPESKEGKLLWIKKHLQLPENRIIIDINKEKYVDSDKSLLIDDREKVLKPWRAAGGTGIQHINTSSTIKQLKKLGL